MRNACAAVSACPGHALLLGTGTATPAAQQTADDARHQQRRHAKSGTPRAAPRPALERGRPMDCAHGRLHGLPAHEVLLARELGAVSWSKVAPQTRST